MKKKKKSFGEAVAVGSAIAGAALGAAAVYLSDKKNQEKLKKTIDEVTEETVKIGKSIKKKADELSKNAQKEEKKVVKKVSEMNKPVQSPKKTPVGKIYKPLKKD